MRSNVAPQKIEQLMNVLACFEAIASELIRFPSLDPDLLRSRIEQFIERCKSTSEKEQ